MSDGTIWRRLAAEHARKALGELQQHLQGSVGTEVERLSRVEEWKRAAADARTRAKLPKWAPLEVCGYYLKVYGESCSEGGSANDWHSHRREASHAALRTLLTAVAMEDVWRCIEAAQVNALSFAITVADEASRCSYGSQCVQRAKAEADGKKSVPWEMQTREARTGVAQSIAKLSRELGKALKESPLAHASLFELIPEREANAIADHCMQSPAGVVAGVPKRAAWAIEDSLPPACSIPTALAELAKRADQLAKAGAPYGRQDETQGARAFVRNVGAFLNEQCRDPMPKVLKACCYLVLDVDFEDKQIRAIVANPIPRR